MRDTSRILLLSHAVVFVALPLTTLGLGFQSIDPALVEAARTMGASENAVLRTVLRPIMLPVPDQRIRVRLHSESK